MGSTIDLIDQYDAWRLMKKEPRRAEVKQWNEEQLKDALLKALYETGKISPQVIGRINLSNVILLHHFDKTDIAKVFDQKLREKGRELGLSTGERITSIKVSDRARKFLVNQAWGANGERAFSTGARAVNDVMNNHIYPELMKLRDASQGKGQILVRTQTENGKEAIVYGFKAE